MSNEHTNGVIAGLRAAGVIADRIADELEFSRCQQVATRIRHEIVQAIRSYESAPAPRVSQPDPADRPSWCWGERWCDGNPCTCRDGAPDASPGTPEEPRCQTCKGKGRVISPVANVLLNAPEDWMTCGDCNGTGTPSTPRGSR